MRETSSGSFPADGALRLDSTLDREGQNGVKAWSKTERRRPRPRAAQNTRREIAEYSAAEG
jgi:hypothetical protein